MISRVALLSFSLLLILAGCSSPPVLDTAAPAAPAEETQAPAIPECESILFDEGAELSGEVIAGCISASFLALNYGKMAVESTDTSGLTTFRYLPDFAATVELSGGNELFIDGENMWFKDDYGWVKAIDDDSDIRAKMAYMIANTFRGLSSPQAAIAMLEAAKVWTQVGDEEIESANGTTFTAWRLDAQPFTFWDVQVESLSLWIDSDFTTHQQLATSSFGDISATTLNRYYDWGVEEEFTAPTVPAS
ncbi:MAG: hypothetical protein ACOH1M_01290 [Rhodoglobus sp.]